jgi:hypothetical protein
MGSTDGSDSYCGWNIDDVLIAGDSLATENRTPYIWLESQGITTDYDAADIADLDGDGLLTWQEYRAGTDPTNASSVFAVLAMDSNGITWYGTTNSGVMDDFVILRATNMLNPVWQAAGTKARSATGTNTCWDPNPPQDVPVFYKICLP